MQQPDEIIYYQVPPFCVLTILLPAYAISDNVWGSTAELVNNPTFEKNKEALKERMEAADPHVDFEMTFLDCVLICQVLSFLEFYYESILLPKKNSNYHFTEKETAHKEILDAIIDQIIKIREEIFVVLPILNKPFCEDKAATKIIANAIKTLGLDKEKVVACLCMVEVEKVNLINAAFAFFTRFLLYGESDFSNRLHEEVFCCTTEIREVEELFYQAKEKAKLNEEYAMPLSLRDLVVLFMMNNLFQKNYFSDGDDEVYEVLESLHTEEEEEKASTEDIRDYMLRTARELDDYLRAIGSHVDGFAEAMQPIYDFAVVV